jgi:1-acyl-sn-glycerol-3-phosphate acyltransferase
VIDPLWLPLATVLAAVLTVIGLLAALVAPLNRRRRVLRLAAFAVLYLYLDVAMLLGCTWFWLRRQTGPEHQRRHEHLLSWALTRLLLGARRTLGFTLDAGDADVVLPLGVPVIVLARHAGPGDSFSLVWLILAHYRRCPRVVLKAALQWDPGLDVLLNRLSSCFLPSRSGSGEDAVTLIADTAARLGPGDALLIFPEGGNWTPRRHRRAIARLERSGRWRAARRTRRRPHVLPPHPAGTLAGLSACPSADVVVVAHAGLDELVTVPQLWQAVPLVDRPMVVRAWHQSAAMVPRDEAGVAGWLDDQWERIETWVRAQAESGTGSGQADAAGTSTRS